jgi:hypothetical protein
MIMYSKKGKRRARLRKRAAAGAAGQRPPVFRGKAAPRTWIADAIKKTVQLGDIAVSLTEGVDIVVLNNSAIKHVYRNRTSFLTALYSATQGSAVKQVGAALGAGAVLVPSGVALAADAFGGIFGAAATAGTIVAGWKVHLSGSVTNMSYRLYQVDVGPIVGAGGLQTLPAPVLSLGVTLRSPAADIVVWSPQNGAGQFALAPGNLNATVLNAATTPSNGIAVRTLTANDFATFEGINMRDIYPRFGACPPAYDEALSDELDYLDEELDGEEENDGAIFTNRGKQRRFRAYAALRDEMED